jgi:hypothetical protein
VVAIVKSVLGRTVAMLARGYIVRNRRNDFYIRSPIAAISRRKLTRKGSRPKPGDFQRGGGCCHETISEIDQRNRNACIFEIAQFMPETLASMRRAVIGVDR